MTPNRIEILKDLFWSGELSDAEFYQLAFEAGVSPEKIAEFMAEVREQVHQEITLALSDVLTGNADEAAALIEAIAAGRIPHISITY